MFLGEIALALLFFPSIIAANAILFWVSKETKKAGIWPTEMFFGFQRRRPFQLLNVMRILQKNIKISEDTAESRRYRRLLNAIYLGYSLGAFALVVLLACAPWLFSQLH